MRATLHILGSGGSTGVPAIGNDWGSCDPDEPKNIRTRPCVIIRSENTTIAVDTGPDFREQYNRAGITRLDAVIYSHAHADHINGMDDLRLLSYRQRQLIPAYGSHETINDLRLRFAHLFPGGGSELYRPILDPLPVNYENYTRAVRAGDIEFSVFEQDHGESGKTLGIRIGDTAYSPDMVTLDAKAVDHLKGIKNWIVDGSGYKYSQNPAHASIDKVVELNKSIGAQNVILIHLTKEMDYKTLLNELPDGYEPGYDGLQVTISI
jgi:phosphoribosyl 1,2-cyclic phosphate phosphodiesterase